MGVLLNLEMPVAVVSDETVKRFSPQMQIGHFIKDPRFMEAIADADFG